MKNISKIFNNVFLLSVLLINGCSELSQYSTYKSTAVNLATIGIFNNTDYNEINKSRDTLRVKFIPPRTFVSIFEISDSAFLGIEEFPGGKVLFFGPPLIPVIPNVFLPFSYSIDNKLSDYHIIMKLRDTVNVDDLKFYRNKKKIMPQSINAIMFSDSLYKNQMYTIIEKNVTTMYPHHYYLFTFSIRKFTTKEIEIRKKQKLLFQINRKKKLKYKPFNFYFS